MNKKKCMIDAVLAGIAIAIGGTVYLSCDNKYIGTFLFGFGLFTIVTFKLALYTGKIGYVPEKDRRYSAEVIVTLVGNLIGTFISAYILRFTKIYEAVLGKAEKIVTSKLEGTFVSCFILAVFCGMLMYIAVESNRISKQNNDNVSAVLGIFLPVAVFILAGFNHSIADMFYISLGKITADKCVYLITVIVGNACGGMFIPFCKILKGESERKK